MTTPDFTPALETLRIAAETCEDNAPIHTAEGRPEQAALSTANAASYRAAMEILSAHTEVTRELARLDRATHALDAAVGDLWEQLRGAPAVPATEVLPSCETKLGEVLQEQAGLVEAAGASLRAMVKGA